MHTTVMKFGGTSVDKINRVGDIIDAEVGRDSRTVAVVSAFSGDTDKLLKIADETLRYPEIQQEEFIALFDDLIRETLQRAATALEESNVPGNKKKAVLDDIGKYLAEAVANVEKKSMWSHVVFNNHPQEQRNYVIDRIVGLGEIFSAHLLAWVFTARNRVKRFYEDVNLHNVFEAGQSPYVFQSGREDKIDQEKLYSILSQEIASRVFEVTRSGVVPVVTGYVGYVPNGILNTIDRGYTDSTAAMAARGLKQLSGQDNRVKLEIWKEVDGLLSADPKIVGKTAQLRRRAHFDEAAELSGLAGMKAINPHGIWVLDGKGVDIHLKNTFDPEGSGTLVSLSDDPEVSGVRFISGKKGQTMLRVSSAKMIEQAGVVADIFAVCKQEGIAVDAVTTSARTVAFSIDQKSVRNEQLFDLLGRYGRVDMKDGMAIVCCIGNNMGARRGLLSWLSGILANQGINIEFDGGDGDRNITFIVREDDYERAIRALHQWMFYPQYREAVRGAVNVIAPFVSKPEQKP